MGIKVKVKLAVALVASISVVTGSRTRYLNDHTNRTIPHQGCLRLLENRIPIQSKLVGEDYEKESRSSYMVKSQAGPTAAKCVNGKAGGYNCKNVDLLSVVSLNVLNFNGGSEYGNDIWGWAKNGREFAMMGIKSGTVFVEVTDPYKPVIVGKLPTHTSSSDWRDIKTIGSYACIVSEASGHGMQIFDLSRLLNASPKTVFSETRYYNGFGNAHNIFINEDTSFAYAVGSNKCFGGLHIINLKNPLSPKQVGCFSSDYYSHDVQCVVYNGPHKLYKGKEICFASNEDTVTIIDVDNKNNIRQLSKKSYQYGYTHQGWLTEDHSYFVFNDEADEYYYSYKTRTHVLDIRNLENPKYIGYHNGRTHAIDHNLYVKGNLIHQANYRAGYNVLEIKDASKAQFQEKGYFDIFPSSDSSNFNGAWSTYPYFPSGNVIVSGIEQGLFVLSYKGVQSNTCAAKSLQLCFRKGCVWRNKKCGECSSINGEKPCRNNGCVWMKKKLQYV